MLKNLPTRGSVIALVAMAACALAAPSTASAASWAVVGSTHVLDASTFSFFTAGASAGATCSTARFHTDVRSAAVLTVTGASFSGCTGTGVISTCSAIITATTLPWSATAVAENDLRIDGVHFGVFFTSKPGASCPLPTTATVTGNLDGAAPGTSTWNFIAHTMTFNGATGLTTHFGTGFGSYPTTVTAGLRDTSQTLTIN
jgi:hypothetical protein